MDGRLVGGDDTDWHSVGSDGTDEIDRRSRGRPVNPSDTFVERSLALARRDGTWTPPQLRSASTVVLLRDTPSGLETYLMRRARSMAFAPGMHVFPGGGVDEADLTTGALLSAHAFPFTEACIRAAANEEEVRALVACAIREVREEAGVVLTEGDLVLADHWITPEAESHRYDVRFFAARLPVGQDARPHGTEADHAVWISPSKALDAHRAGELPMLPPTVAAIAFLAAHATADQVLSAAANRWLAPRMPRALVGEDGSLRWVIVNERTGEVLADRIGPPEASEVEGIR